jgi:hypothetical protein
MSSRITNVKINNKHKKIEKLKTVLKLIFNFKNITGLNKNKLLVDLCINILNQKFYELGILKPKQSIDKKNITKKNFFKRAVKNIIKTKIPDIKYKEIINLFKKKKVCLNGKIIEDPNLLIGIKSERVLDIKIN